MNPHETIPPEAEPLEAIHTVNKIGGANMSKLNEVASLISILKSKGESVTLVVSAFKGVTDTLIQAMDLLNGKNYSEADIDQAFSETKHKHFQVIDAFFTDTKKESSAVYLSEFEKLKAALMTHKQISTILLPVEGSFQMRDQVIAFGERMAAKFLKLYLEKQGHAAHHFEEMSCPEGSFKSGPISESNLHESMQRAVIEAVRATEETRDDVIRIFGGHVGGTPRGIAVDVGRSYSDTTAVNVALALRKMGIQIHHTRFWKAVDGVLTANPNDLNGGNKPFLHAIISLAEALEMASAGSGLMQIDALALAAKHALDLEIRNIDKPNKEVGTRFSNVEVKTGRVFKAIISNPNIDLITIGIPAMANREGFNEAIAHVLTKHGISVDGIFTEGTSISFSIPLPQDDADKGSKRASIQKALEELSQITVAGETHELTSRTWNSGKYASLAIVGNELDSKGIAAVQMFLSVYGIDVMAISHAENRKRITFCIPSNLRQEAIQKLHSIFVDGDVEVIDDFKKRVATQLAQVTSTYGKK